MGGASVYPALPCRGEPMSAAVCLRGQASLRPHGNGREPGGGRRGGPAGCTIAPAVGERVCLPPPRGAVGEPGPEGTEVGKGRCPPWASPQCLNGGGCGPLSAPASYGALNASVEVAVVSSVPQPRWPWFHQQLN